MENVGNSSSGGSGGLSSECEGEDQDESSSSSHSQALDEALGNLQLEDSDLKTDGADELNNFSQDWREELATPPPHEGPAEPAPGVSEKPAEDNKEEDDELSEFRSQWQRELDSTPSPQRGAPRAEPEPEPASDEERAKQLFLRGVEFERAGKLYEAIQHYKRAMQILPDVEARLYESTSHRADTPEAEESSSEDVEVTEEEQASEDEAAVPGEGLLSRLQRAVARRGALCGPRGRTEEAHISWLPYEVMVVVARWVVGCELDAGSLERLGAVCRGLYVLAREPLLWRAVCVRTWGLDCGTPRAHGFDSWRQMYIERPRLNLHGCYISKTTYLRHGETSFQDCMYRPWYLIDYYRYLRFFADGVVLWWTTPDEPAACVSHLRQRLARPSLGIMAGHYRLVHDTVVIIIKKPSGDKKPAQASNTRFRARRKEAPDAHDQTFHLELQVRCVRGRRNWQLQWRRYAVSTRRDQWTHFDLPPSRFPPFAFSRVRAYTAAAAAPLPHLGVNE